MIPYASISSISILISCSSFIPSFSSGDKINVIFLNEWGLEEEEEEKEEMIEAEVPVAEGGEEVGADEEAAMADVIVALWSFPE